MDLLRRVETIFTNQEYVTGWELVMQTIDAFVIGLGLNTTHVGVSSLSRIKIRML